MVASGFAERTDVSQYRLVAHLLLACAIYIYTLTIALRLLAPVAADGAASVVPELHPRGRGCESAGCGTTDGVPAVRVHGARVAPTSHRRSTRGMPLAER